VKSVVISSLTFLILIISVFAFHWSLWVQAFQICWSFQWNSFQFQWFSHFSVWYFIYFHFDFYYFFSSAYFGLTCSSNFLMKKLSSPSWEFSPFNIDLSTISFPLSTPLWHPQNFDTLCFHFYSGQNAFQFPFWLLLWSMGIRIELYNTECILQGSVIEFWFNSTVEWEHTLYNLWKLGL